MFFQMQDILDPLPKYRVNPEKAKMEAGENISLQTHIPAHFVEASDPFVCLASINGAGSHVQDLETNR